jgi:hypothetical protein
VGDDFAFGHLSGEIKQGSEVRSQRSGRGAASRHRRWEMGDRRWGVSAPGGAGRAERGLRVQRSCTDYGLWGSTGSP